MVYPPWRGPGAHLACEHDGGWVCAEAVPARAPTRVLAHSSPQVLARFGSRRVRALRRLWAPAVRHPGARRRY